jgi:[acyl-carrier-protein] S-malonyltransferase
VVISGSAETVARAGEIAKAKGVKRAIPLSVSAPFHCPLMQPAADRMARALDEITIRPPAVMLLANVVAAPSHKPETIRRLLIEQVTGRVRWRESILALKGLQIDTTVEFGGNKVLTGMVKRIDKDLATVTLDTPADLEAFGKGL